VPFRLVHRRLTKVGVEPEAFDASDALERYRTLAVPQAAELAFNSRAAAVRRRVYEKAGGGQIMFT